MAVTPSDPSPRTAPPPSSRESRLSAYADLIATFEEAAEADNDAFLPYCRDPAIVKSWVEDEDLSCREKGLEVAIALVQFGGREVAERTGRLVVPAAVKSCFVSAWNGVSDKATELCAMYVEVGDDSGKAVIADVIDGLGQTNPSIVVASLRVLRTLIASFSPTTLVIQPILLVLPTLLSSDNPLIKSEALSLSQTIYSFLGQDELLRQLPSPEPSQRGQLEAAFQEADAQGSGMSSGRQTRWTRSQQRENEVKDAEGALEGRPSRSRETSASTITPLANERFDLASLTSALPHSLSSPSFSSSPRSPRVLDTEISSPSPSTSSLHPPLQELPSSSNEEDEDLIDFVSEHYMNRDDESVELELRSSLSSTFDELRDKERTPRASRFNLELPPLPPPVPPKDPFASFTRRGSSPLEPTIALLPLNKPRPNINHRKTHSGTFGGGIHKRNLSSSSSHSSRLSFHRDSTTPLWDTNDVVSLEEHGVKVHDFRPTSSTENLAMDLLEITQQQEDLRMGDSENLVTVDGAFSPRPSISRNSSSSSNRSTSGISKRHGRTGSRSSIITSPLLTKSPLLPLAPPTKRVAQAISGEDLLKRLESGALDGKENPLLVVDVRSLTAFLGDGGRIKGSVNVNFPSLLIKRFRKGNTANFTLSSFITTETGKSTYQTTTSHAFVPGTLDGVDVVVVDRDPETRDPASTSAGSVLLSVLERREEHGTILFLSDPYPSKDDPKWSRWFVVGEPEEDNAYVSDSEVKTSAQEGRGASSGLLTLQPPPPSSTTTTISQDLHHSATIEEVRTPTLSIPEPLVIPRTPTSPNPPITIPSPKTPGGRNRPPKLRRIDTSENLLGTRSTNHHYGSPSSRPRSRSPKGRSDAQHPPARRVPPPMSIQSLCHVQSQSPSSTASRFRESDLEPPPTARPSFASNSSSNFPNSPSSPQSGGSSDVPPFEMSSIIPGFLFLGPEPTKSEDLDELEGHGVKQILNLALECDDKTGEIGRRFEKYWKIPMRDFVEETGVQNSIDEACRILSDAQLRSKPIYCHCRAGKSRSVTIVLAYLVHRNHWSLKKAYAHVSERRKGISPNIGFVAELMRFEERERGGKSHGVFGTTPGHPSTHTIAQSASASYFSLPSEVEGSKAEENEPRGTRGRGRIRDSLPPGRTDGGLALEGEREVEILGVDGSWRVNAPVRRASRAGLESAAGGFTSWGE